MTEKSENSDQKTLQAVREELAQREYEISLLRETTQAIGSELDFDTVLQIIADRARELIRSETLLIPILDEACGLYTYQAGSGRDIDEIVGESLPIEFGVCGWVWRHKRAWWRGMLSELSEEERNRWEKEAGTLIMVPLIGRKHFLGGLAGIDKQGGGDFSERDLKLLELFAGHVAIAIENAMAVKEVESARRATEDYQHALQNLNRRLSMANQELENLSLYDQLTKLPNRSLFLDRVRQHLDAVNDKGGLPFAVLIVDINRFQDINDVLGQDGGDELLKIVSKRYLNALTSKHTLSRMSGDEFAVLLCDIDERRAVEMAERVLDSIKDPVRVMQQEVVVTATVGIAIYPQHGGTVSELIKHGDAAMNTAKREQHAIHLFDEDRDSIDSGRLGMVRDLKNALDGEEFELHYQPKVALFSGNIVGVEALARWHHKQRGWVPPDMFITALEQTGLIAPFSYWVIETALKQRQQWLKKGHEVKIAINIPITLILAPGFITELNAIVDRYPTANGIVIEITENIFMSDYQRLNTVLRQLQEIGFNFSIDDFGTGHSSLSRLRQLPVTELKVDRSFVMDMLKSKDDEIIVKSTIELAHNLGLMVVAEGVENEDIMRQLYRMRCDIAQGYHISKALPPAEIEHFFTTSKWPLSPSIEEKSGSQQNEQ
ncbi:putative bifunctional diguanylate cyclase/phosphodiesterase [Candidatus Reidiella endopervernicosa]|nr:bifunctional diguanylate cyclase/phosphodiesterase [Candidatus Reidiella endopervernicosa]QKQ27195.1 bifunctional diguanylate cyclase/phosphodiesterase [Candidatus Reidiella endopervernicosa]